MFIGATAPSSDMAVEPAPQDPAQAPILRVASLTIGLRGLRDAFVKDLSFNVAPGETVAIVGESGSGKSLTSLAIMRLLAPVLHTRAGGQIVLSQDGKETDLLTASERQMRGIRGGDIGMIFQEPMTSVNPLFTIGAQIEEALKLHRALDAAARRREAVALLDRVGIREPEMRLRAYPHELSGGMRQRAMIAMALAGQPKVLIADEPTTALDVTIQAQILDLLRDLRDDLGMAMIFVTHDLGVVAQLADRVVVMQSGVCVESGPVQVVLTRPSHAYTRKLIAAVPSLDTRPPARAAVAVAAPLVQVRGIEKTFDLPNGHKVQALRNVSLDLHAQEIVGVVGESGSGKSTVAKLLVGLEEPDAGALHFDGRPISYRSKDRQSLRRAIQMIFQDPFAALNPRWRIEHILTEPMIVHRLNGGAAARRAAAVELLQRVGLDADALRRYPHEFSGGQRQRLSIARALAVQPQVLIADESVSALDVTVQAQVLDLLREIRSDLRMAILFIAHDLAVVNGLCDRVCVMRHGEVVETGPVSEVFQRPQAAYTKDLLAAVPRLPEPGVISGGH
ncbi:MAG: ABC transporter ATP-binding protein [Pseudomonadota bacterium]